MDEDNITVISFEVLPPNENQNQEKERKENREQKDHETSPWYICHVFSVLTVCVLFLATLTLIPRSN